VGEIFGRRYELLDPIAEGAMGSIWRVYDQQDGDIKAAKLLRHRDSGSLLRFMREQGTRIHHPHVVTPLSWVGEDDSVLFTMPLVRGGSVAELLGDFGALPQQWVAAIVEQTLDALAAVHAVGVIHRDIKPANLLLDATGRGRPFVRLTDFGIAAPLGEPRLTMVSQAIGTPGYMSPEQQAGAEPTPQQDIFAVGVVGLVLLCGHRPPIDRAEVPDSALARVLLAAMSPDPARRPPSAQAMRAAVLDSVRLSSWDPGDVEVFDHFAPEDEPPAASVPMAEVPPRAQPPTAEVPPRSRRDGTWPWIVLSIGAALLGVAGWLYFG
jgi:serine/threonine-protein kinase